MADHTPGGFHRAPACGPMDDRPPEWRRLPRPLLAVGALLVLIAWSVPWLTAGFGGFFQVDILYWGMQVDAGGDSDFESWFSSEWDDIDGIEWGRLGVVLGALGWLGVVFTLLLPWLPRMERVRQQRTPVAAASVGALAVGLLIVTLAMVEGLDGDVSMGDWEAGFWLAWIGAFLAAGGAVIAWQAQRPQEERTPEESP